MLASLIIKPKYEPIKNSNDPFIIRLSYNSKLQVESQNIIVKDQSLSN